MYIHSCHICMDGYIYMSYVQNIHIHLYVYVYKSAKYYEYKCIIRYVNVRFNIMYRQIGIIRDIDRPATYPTIRTTATLNKSKSPALDTIHLSAPLKIRSKTIFIYGIIKTNK